MQDIYFKEGDKVSHQAHGNGVVKSADNISVVVEFIEYYKNTVTGRIIRFQSDGRSAIDDKYPTLLQGHDRFDPQPNNPIFEPKYGELVWAKVNDCWCVYYYDKPHESINGRYEVKTDPQHTKGFYLASEIRPFKGEIPNH